MCIKAQEEFNQSTKTSSSLPSPVLVSGTFVMSSEGWVVVIAVGPRSVLGKIQARVEPIEKPAQLSDRFTGLKNFLALVSTYGSFITMSVLLVRFVLEELANDGELFSHLHAHCSQLFGYLLIIVSLSVALEESVSLAVVTDKAKVVD
mmetsp:Transcript_35304/g.40780  ORF Transcript_35304/g.40780 Transcript_35304/m.40780 type:complete len:148 (-) Transcript_35304:2086-2529(-)